ncbi:hypothetical protein E3N88_20159 [Mikania micrantha]|uniref:Uncharacterized protein n=1 Tax=Mikania micrantha TaxID=192012 RepID=A0A5N6NG76_9ASTR|nr:hypothetical protein E3N88_20159 [Mikania micrantha]
MGILSPSLHLPLHSSSPNVAHSFPKSGDRSTQNTTTPVAHFRLSAPHVQSHPPSSLCGSSTVVAHPPTVGTITIGLVVVHRHHHLNSCMLDGSPSQYFLLIWLSSVGITVGLVGDGTTNRSGCGWLSAPPPSFGCCPAYLGK